MRLILGPRPGKKSRDSIAEQGVTHLVTLLSAREQPDSVARIARSIGAEWQHFPMDGGHLDTLAQVDLSQLFLLHDEIVRANPDAVIYLHCSAGIHRTGFVAYLWLRYRGLEADQAKVELGKLRAVTVAQVGDERISLADEMLAQWQLGAT